LSDLDDGRHRPLCTSERKATKHAQTKVRTVDTKTLVETLAQAWKAPHDAANRSSGASDARSGYRRKAKHRTDDKACRINRQLEGESLQRLDVGWMIVCTRSTSLARSASRTRGIKSSAS
jgi:hypothetical protein